MLRARHEPKTITSGHGPPWYPEARVTLSTRELCGIEAIVTVCGAGKRWMRSSKSVFTLTSFKHFKPNPHSLVGKSPLPPNIEPPKRNHGLVTST